MQSPTFLPKWNVLPALEDTAHSPFQPSEQPSPDLYNLSLIAAHIKKLLFAARIDFKVTIIIIISNVIRYAEGVRRLSPRKSPADV